MNITHESMMALTAQMPMKTIEINGEPYLERYFAHMLADGTQVWYHRFLRNDTERHLHSHPWSAVSTILVGHYEEEFWDQDEMETGIISYGPDGEHQNTIREDTIHRIISVEKNTWTQIIVDPGRLDTWFFIEAGGRRTVMPTSPFEWHKDFQPRPAA